MTSFPKESTWLMLKRDGIPAVAMLKSVSVRITHVAGLIGAGFTVTNKGEENILVQEANILSTGMSESGIDKE